MGKKAIFRRFIGQLIFIVALYAIISSLMATGAIDKYLSYIMTTATIYAIVCLGINLVTGMTGQLLLGQAGFMSIGAYTAAVLLKMGVPILAALIAGALVAAVIGLLVGMPLFRLRGDYLAIVTLAVGEIVVVVMNNLGGLTGGASGLTKIPNIPIEGHANWLINLMTGLSNKPVAEVAGNVYGMIKFLWPSIFLVLTILALVHIMTSSHGRTVISVREDEVSSEAMGVNVYYTKVYAFVISTFLAGLGGGLFAANQGYLNPSQFNFLTSINFLVIVVFGGLGSLTGTVIASFFLVILQEKLRFLQNYRMVIYPLLLIFMMIFRPQGLLGTKEFLLTSTILSRAWWIKQITRFKAWCIRVAKAVRAWFRKVLNKVKAWVRRNRGEEA